MSDAAVDQSHRHYGRSPSSYIRCQRYTYLASCWYPAINQTSLRVISRSGFSLVIGATTGDEIFQNKTNEFFNPNPRRTYIYTYFFFSNSNVYLCIQILDPIPTQLEMWRKMRRRMIDLFSTLLAHDRDKSFPQFLHIYSNTYMYIYNIFITLEIMWRIFIYFLSSYFIIDQLSLPTL